MDSSITEHHGRVIGVADNHIFVCIDSRGESRDCTGCALAQACSVAYGGSRTVAVAIPDGLLSPPKTGCEVTVKPETSARRHAAIVLFAFPLAVLLAVATVCTVLGLSDGSIGILSLFATALCFFLLYLRRNVRKPEWRLTGIYDEAEANAHYGSPGA